MDSIRKIIQEILKLDVFDFDSTLVNTPMPEDGEKETGKKWGYEWWNSSESLDTKLYDMKPNDDVIKDQKDSAKNNDTETVMITGRKEKLSKNVNKIIDDLELEFDQRLFNSGKETSQDKIDKMEKILKDNSSIEEVEVWEDRHVDIYRKWGNKKVKSGDLKDFKINHIKESEDKVTSADLEFRDEHVTSYDGQENWELGLYQNDEIIGLVEYTLYDGELTVSDIVVVPNERRKGHASRMMKHIKNLHPDYEYKPSMKTPDGMKFKPKDNIEETIREMVRKVLREDYGYDDYEDVVDYEEQYYTAKLPDDVKKWNKPYVGKNVTWYGDPEQMIVIHKDRVHGMFGNVYDPNKVRFLIDLIHNSPENVELECAYAIGGVTDLIDIKEEQEAVAGGRFETDYEGHHRAATTGNQWLDEYIGKPADEQDFANTLTDNSVVEFFDEHKLEVAFGMRSVEDLTEMFKELNPDKEEIDAFGQFIQMEEDVKEAQDNEEGDFNKFVIQLRDGHHRATAAIESGEDYICVNLDKNDLKKFAGRYQNEW